MGGAGIAPYATILSYCVAYDEYGNMFDYDIISAIYDAVDNGADIINMSYGGIGYNPLQQEAIDYAYENGVTCIAAMGNTGSNAIEYPAAYEHVIAVTATDKSNNRAWFSNYGNWSDVSAPGPASSPPPGAAAIFRITAPPLLLPWSPAWQLSI